MAEVSALADRAVELYRANAAYLAEAEPIVKEMANLRLMFTSPKLIIDVTGMTIEEEWTSSQAAGLYSNYAKLLEVLHDRYFPDPAKS